MRPLYLAICISSILFAACSEEQIQEPGLSKQEASKEAEKSDACYGIVNGQATNNHPAVGLIVRPYNGNQFFFCTATFIAKNAMLTSSHCTEDGKLPRYLAGNNHSLPLQLASYNNAPVAAEVVHHGVTYTLPNIDANNDEHRKRDAAVLIFAEDISDDIMPLAAARPAVGSTVTLVGFGQTDTSTPVTAFTKRQGNNTLVNYNFSDLVAINGPFNTTANETRTMALPGDSGGPLIHNGEVVGMLSTYILSDQINLYTESNSALTKALFTNAAAKGAKIPGYYDFPDPPPADEEPPPGDLVAEAAEEDSEDSEDEESRRSKRSTDEGIDLCNALR